LLRGTWKDLLAQVNHGPNAPAVIVSSRLADDRLWAEALNLGAWDVLARPFVRSEVFQAVSAAWRHWWNRQAGYTPSMPMVPAVGWGASASAAAHW
jgi:FixJ family two-component response regulator